MHTFLIIGNPKDTKKEVEKLKTKLSVTVLPFDVQKIADVRNMNQITNLKVNGKTAILIENFELISDEAQNALLKNLEEPQEGLFYILTATTTANILETIISRSEKIEIRGDLILTTKQREKIEEFIKMPIGAKLLFTSKITKRDDAISFLTNFIYIVQKEAINDIKLFEILETAQTILKRIKANGNVQLQLTSFVINF